MRFYRSDWPSVRAHFYDVLQIPSPKAAAKQNLPIFVDREGPPQGTFLLSILIVHGFSYLVRFFACPPLSILVYTCLHMSILVYGCPQLSLFIVVYCCLCRSTEKLSSRPDYIIPGRRTSKRLPKQSSHFRSGTSTILNVYIIPSRWTSKRLLKFSSHFRLMNVTNPKCLIDFQPPCLSISLEHVQGSAEWRKPLR